MTKDKTSKYWDSYYSSSAVPNIPSQFCVFVANEFPEHQSVVEIGCGNGRDSFYFASLGRRVLAVDGSEAAIENCRMRAKESALPATFLVGDVGNPDCLETVLEQLQSNGGTIVYARFFLHAITEEAETGLLNIAEKILSDREGVFCLEFRTRRDEALRKMTGEHYRRFIDIPDFLARTAKRGLVCNYLVEGFGMAKFGNDDAYVARTIMRLE